MACGREKVLVEFCQLLIGRHDAIAEKILVPRGQIVVPERAQAPASRGNPIGPDRAGGIVETDADAFVGIEGIRGAVKAEDVLGVGSAIRGQPLDPIEVGRHAFPQVALRARRLQVNGGVDPGRNARILAAVEDEPMPPYFEHLLQQGGRKIRPGPLIGKKLLGGHTVLGGPAEIDGHALEHLRLDPAVTFQEGRIIGYDLLHRLAEGLGLVVGEVSGILDAA